MSDAAFVPPTLALHLDASHCPVAGGRVHLVCEVTTPPTLAPLSRRPLDLVLVLDTSGSMAGDKLEALKRASVGLIARLTPSDRVSLVTFAEGVRVHGQHAAPYSASCAQLILELMQLRAGGNTNLSGGWLTGVELALGAEEAGRRRVLILLSDGHANAGEVQPSRLASFAAQASERGIATTCVGVGADYSIAQLGAICEASGSRFHHADTAEAIQAVFAGELGELETTSLDFADLAVALPEGCVVHPWGTDAHSVDGSVHMFRLGALLAGSLRRLILAIDVPPAREGSEQPFHVALHGMNSLDGAPVTLGASLSLRWSDRGPVQRNSEDVLRVVQQWRAWLERAAASANELGDCAAVQELAALHLPKMRAYARNHPGAEQEFRACADALARASAPMSPRECKEAFVDARKRERGERDLRGK